MVIGSVSFQLSEMDKKRGISLPEEVTEDLAYLCGMFMGDGHLSYRENKKNYSIKCVGNPTDEKDLYDNVIAPLFSRMFGINVKPRIMDNSTTYGIIIHSKTIVRFLSENIGIPLGAKSGIIRIPYVFKNNDKLMKSFLCGFADADFCLSLKRRYRDIQYYPVIEGASKSRRIMEGFSEYLESVGFKVSRDFDRPVFDERIQKSVIVHRIDLYGHKQLVLWMKLIGFRSPKNIRKFELWRERNKAHSRASIRQLAGGGFEFGDRMPIGMKPPPTFGSLNFERLMSRSLPVIYDRASTSTPGCSIASKYGICHIQPPLRV